VTLRMDDHGKSRELITVKLEKFTYGGACLGHLPATSAQADGRAVFVPFTLPGETVLARVVEQKAGHIRAELVELLEPSLQRIIPRCKHFFSPGQEMPGGRACGGCHYQHLSYADQLITKSDILRDQLARIGKIEDPPIEPVVPSPQEWYYRNHIQFHLSPAGKLGFIAADHTEQEEYRQRRNRPAPAVLPIRECHLPESLLNDIWPALQFAPGLGLERVSLRLGADGEVMLVLESGDVPELELEAGLSVVHLLDGESVVLAGEESLAMDLLGRTFRISAASFFQVNSAMAAKMVEHLLTCLPLPRQATVLDVYCGAGLFSAFFAPRCSRLIGIESAPSACEDFASNLDEFENVELYEGAAEDILSLLDVKPDLVIVDPPRAGLHLNVLDSLQALSPAHIAYISCDPSTLARDARRLLDGGYRLTSITPFDLFPQTYHIESISIFEK
jgi:23S rRNA (uracil1939-C5)-methyltransferase